MCGAQILTKLEKTVVEIVIVTVSDMETGRNPVRAWMKKGGVKIEVAGDICGDGQEV